MNALSNYIVTRMKEINQLGRYFNKMSECTINRIVETFKDIIDSKVDYQMKQML